MWLDFCGFYRSALRNDQAANCAGVQGLRRTAFTSPRGGFYLLQTSRAFHEGLLQRLSAVVRTGSLRKLMSTIVSHGLAIALETLFTRALVLKGRSWTLRCVRTTARSSPIKGIPPPRAGMFLLGNVSKMGKHPPLGRSWTAFDLWRLMDPTYRPDHSPLHTITTCNHQVRPIVPSPSGTAESRMDFFLFLAFLLAFNSLLHCSLLSCLERTLQATKSQYLINLVSPTIPLALHPIISCPVLIGSFVYFEASSASGLSFVPRKRPVSHWYLLC